MIIAEDSACQRKSSLCPFSATRTAGARDNETGLHACMHRPDDILCIAVAEIEHLPLR